MIRTVSTDGVPCGLSHARWLMTSIPRGVSQQGGQTDRPDDVPGMDYLCEGESRKTVNLTQPKHGRGTGRYTCLATADWLAKV